MRDSEFSRRRFVALGAAVPAVLGPLAAEAQAPAAPSQLPASVPAGLPQRLKRSLVLSGGGALGSYEAGVVQSIVERSGVSDGLPLPQYGIIAGTSVGAINAFFVATGQYSKLRTAWATVASQKVIRLKPQFSKLTNASSGLANRVAQAIGLAIGLFKDVRGVLDSEPIKHWLETNCDFNRPVLTPLVWAVTNLTKQSPEYFYLLPESINADVKRFALASVRLAVGPLVPVREANRSILVDQIRASAAIPLAFDPVTLPGPNGAPADYCDGGVTANTPVDVARAASSAVDAVLLNPATTQPAAFRNAIDIAAGTFGTMQRRLMEDSLAKAYLETLALRAVKQMPPSFTDDITRRSGVDAAQLSALSDLLKDTGFFILRPEKELPIKMIGFDDADAIERTYQIGQSDGTKDFVPFDYSMLS